MSDGWARLAGGRIKSYWWSGGFAAARQLRPAALRYVTNLWSGALAPAYPEQPVTASSAPEVRLPRRNRGPVTGRCARAGPGYRSIAIRSRSGRVQVGFELDHDTRSEHMHVVQLTRC
jgi:hypothetical protein